MHSIKMKVVMRNDIPPNFKEPYLDSAYRPPNSSLRDCMCSMVGQNNETVNIWTHLLPGLYFAYMLYWVHYDTELGDRLHRFPLEIFIFSAAVYPMLSGMAHMFNAHSSVTRHICFFLDYAGLALYSHGSALAYKAYVFPTELKDTLFSNVYLYLTSLMSIMSIILACRSRYLLPSKGRKWMRVCAFGLPYLLASSPLLYRVLLCEPWFGASLAVYYHRMQFFFAFSAFFLYSLHLPERWYRKTFDVWGHSHQWFHIASILATVFQIAGIKLDIEVSMSNERPPQDISEYETMQSLAYTVILTNFTSLCLFIASLYAMPDHPVLYPTNSNLYRELGCTSTDKPLQSDPSNQPDPLNRTLQTGSSDCTLTSELQESGGDIDGLDQKLKADLQLNNNHFLLMPNGVNVFEAMPEL